MDVRYAFRSVGCTRRESDALRNSRLDSLGVVNIHAVKVQCVAVCCSVLQCVAVCVTVC